jgi:DNA-binding HxlR family transcriptional regulator
MTHRGLGHGPFSPEFHAASELVGRKWTGAIIYAIFHGRNRFSEIAEAIPGLSDRLLHERLKELVRQGILEKQDAGTSAPAGYRLTDKGLALRSVMIALYSWAINWPGRDQS